MNYLKVALYNGAHEASYYYYRRELYPREIGAWDIDIDNGYKSRVRVRFDLGKDATEERDDIFHTVNAFALYSDTFVEFRRDPFYYGEFIRPLKISRNVTAEVMLHVCYRDKFQGMAGVTDAVLRHELLGLPAVYNHKSMFSQVIGRVQAEIAAHAAKVGG